MASQVPSYAVCKSLMPTPSASSFLNKSRTDCRVLDCARLSNPALAELMATGLPRTLAVGQRALAASGDTRAVVADPQVRYFGAALDARGLTPDGANPRIGPTRFDEWLSRTSRG